MNLSSQLGFTVFMNIAAAILAITGIVLYAIDLVNASLLWMCELISVAHNGENCRTVALLAQVSIHLQKNSCNIWHDLVSLHNTYT